jgi:hypothetical protein
MDVELYVALDPSSVKAAEDREHREQLAASSILSITRVSAEELRTREFWRRVEAKQAKRQPLRWRAAR